MIAVGAPAPPISATAVVTGRRFRLADWRATPVLFTFVDYRSAGRVRPISVAVRRRIPRHTDLLLVTVVQLQMVPSLMRGVAQGILEGAVRQAAADIPAGFDPADQLVVLPDWDGALSRAFVLDPGGEGLPALALVDGAGVVSATAGGPAAEGVVLDWLDELMQDRRP